MSSINSVRKLQIFPIFSRKNKEIKNKKKMTKKCSLIPAFIHATVIQISMPKFRRSCIISEKPGHLPKK